MNINLDNFAFMAKIDNSNNVLQLLKAINFKDTGMVLCSENGLKVTVEDSKCAQANAFIQADMFQEYELQEEVAFKLYISELVKCLNTFGCSNSQKVSPALKMCYKEYGYPLKLLLEEGGVVTDCNIKTLDPEDTLDFNFLQTDVVNKIILKSECLRDIFSDLDMSSEIMEIIMSPESPHFRVTTFGLYGDNHTDVPMDSEAIESFSCKETTKNRYKLSLMRYSLKPLAASQKVSVRVDGRGFLCLQFMIRTEGNHVAFIEFYCSPEEELED